MDKDEIEIYFNNQQVIDQFLRQLEKDLEIENNSLSCQFDETNLFQKIHDLILPVVEKNMKHNYGNFISKLYRIDVSEQKISDALKNKSSLDYADVTELILQKEMQKIITRLVYANRNNTTN